MDVRAAYPANITVDTDLEGLPFGSQSDRAVWTELNESTSSRQFVGESSICVLPTISHGCRRPESRQGARNGEYVFI